MNPPKNSRIMVEYLDNSSMKLYWFSSTNKFLHSLMIIVCILWFIAWLGGFTQIIIDIQGQNFNELFLSFLTELFIWIMSGCLGAFLFYFMLRPQKPECLILTDSYFDYDSGRASIIPIIFDLRLQLKTPTKWWFKLFKSRIILKKVQKGFIKIIYKKNPSTIILEKDQEKIILGDSLSDSEIDWLYHQLKPWSI